MVSCLYFSKVVDFWLFYSKVTYEMIDHANRKRYDR